MYVYVYIFVCRAVNKLLARLWNAHTWTQMDIFTIYIYIYKCICIDEHILHVTASWGFLWLVLARGVAAVPKICTKRKLLVQRCKVCSFQCFAKISLRRSVLWVQSAIVEIKHEHSLCFVPATPATYLYLGDASMEGRIKHRGKPGYQ